MPVSFKTDILPMVYEWQPQMLWRLDLRKYEDVKMNAGIIYAQISTQSMPPAPYTPLTDDQVSTFKQWMNEGCPP